MVGPAKSFDSVAFTGSDRTALPFSIVKSTYDSSFNCSKIDLGIMIPLELPMCIMDSSICYNIVLTIDSLDNIVHRPEKPEKLFLYLLVRYTLADGEVPEWLKGLVLKTSVPATVPRVRIPPSPPVNYFLGN